MTDNSTLRANSRAQLGGSIFSNAWLLMLAVCAIQSVVLSISGYVVVGPLLVGGALAYALARITVKAATNPTVPVDFSDLLCGFRERFSDTLVLYLLKNVFIFLWTLLFIVPGIIKRYAYGLSDYLLQDDPALTPRAALDKSQALMDGYKAQLFCLDLSFIGWYILGALCCGIGVFFVVPYHQMARANFYLARVASIEYTVEV